MARLDSPVNPRLPDPNPGTETAGYLSGLLSVLRLYFNRITSIFQLLLGPSGGSFLQNPHALLMSNEDQSNPSITGANQLTFNQPIITQGVRVENTDEIWFEKSGQYLVTFRLQVSNRGNTAAEFEVWASYDGTNYPLSNTRFDVPVRKSASINSHIVPTISGIFTVANPQTEYLTIKWWSDSTDVYLEHYAAGTSPTRPEIPSVILTVNFVSRLP
jgi:hypothetical protein